MRSIIGSLLLGSIGRLLDALYNGLVDLPTRSRFSVVTFVAPWKSIAFPLVVRRVLVATLCVLAPVPSRRTTSGYAYYDLELQ